MNNHLVGGEIHGEVDFLVGVFLVPIVKGVDHALAHAHSDAVAIVLAKPRGFSHPETHLLGEIDAFDLRLQHNFEVLGVGSHLLCCCRPWYLQCERLMGNIAAERESMEQNGHLLCS